MHTCTYNPALKIKEGVSTSFSLGTGAVPVSLPQFLFGAREGAEMVLVLCCFHEVLATQ